ncbi:MAG TPA: c-type cytochrome [Casimicrobiaceae bacterium]|nr:c-type cytochrome [Casimicrobiaceae bacterium]
MLRATSMMAMALRSAPMLVLLTACALAQAAEPARYGIGRAATPAEIAAFDIDVRPDGTGLPEGRGSVADGQRIYDDKCASCHGTFGESNDYMAIAGGVGTLGTDQPMRTTGSKLNYATTLFDYIRRAMPFNAPKSLANDEVYALTAYVLSLSDIVPADTVLDRRSLVALEMPNRDGFTTDHGFMRADGKPDTHASACMADCVTSVRLASEIPEYARDSHGDLAVQMRQSTGGASSAATPTQGAASAATPTSGAAADLAARAGCTACHGVTQAIVGPAFADVARRYHGRPDAAVTLAKKVRQGGAGAWGAVPMPPQAIGDGDLQAVIGWILDRLQ